MASSLPSSQYPLHINDIHYTQPHGRLQTLDLCLLRAPTPTWNSKSIWIIYVHGGAWRDPAQDSKCVLPTIKHLEKSHSQALNHIAGIASLNYRLSPYPGHPTDPSKDGDDQRNVQHPEHIKDVHQAIHYLKNHYHVRRWVGVGHSCGATLLLQAAAGIGSPLVEVPKAKALILLEGIYDIPLFLRNHTPPACPPSISKIYYDIIQGAFRSSSDYLSVSPIAGSYSTSTWREGRLIVLAHSTDDELVEEEQREAMLKRLKEEGWKLKGETDGDGNGEEGRIVDLRDLKGGHDEIWEGGAQIAELVASVVSKVCGG